MGRLKDDSGAAIASALMVLVLLAGVTAGVTALVITDTRVRALDGTRTQSFYAAHAGLEQLTADLGDLFAKDYAPTGAEINALSANAPTNLGATWLEPDGTSGYRVTFPMAGGNPQAQVMTVLSGPFQGLVGMATPYQMTVTGRLNDGSEASLTRTVQTVAIPVFQFGLFSENDLSFFAGPNFDFGGRVHSNASVFLASGDGSTLTLRDKVTAVNEVVRTNLSNGWGVGVNYTGNVRIIRAPATFRNLQTNEASLVGTLGSAQNEPTWTNISTGTYNHYIENGRTGARRLDLPIVSAGATPIDLVRGPAPGGDAANPDLLAQRYFRMASLRILLSDTAADITNLPTVTAVAPVPLLAVMPAGYVGAPFALSPGPNAAGDRTAVATPRLGGFIKMEMQTIAGAWQDVTLEILNLGISGRQWPDPATGNPGCAEPNPNAIVRLQRVRDFNDCSLNGSAVATNYWPNVLYDTREAVQRDATNDADPIRFGGIMHYIEVDARNLSRWFQGVIGVSGANAENNTGYVLYFSDRRTNRNLANQETGEYGFEDIINPGSATGAPNGVLDLGEDFNANNALDTYGQNPSLIAGMAAPLNAAARPWTSVDPGNVLAQAEEIGIARRNPAIFFRRGLKLVNGGLGNLVAPGLAVASENPVYIQGHWNANAGAGFGNPHVATAVIADAVTFLSGSWSDRNSFLNPHAAGPRNATTTWYRAAIIAGKGLSFPQPAGTGQDYGTDGGAHNFLRYLEDWGGQALNYRGSIVSLFTSRQANGTYKCCADVYAPPTRGYSFDTEFLTPALLPPKTPMFRDINATGFAQLIRPR